MARTARRSGIGALLAVVVAAGALCAAPPARADGAPVSIVSALRAERQQPENACGRRDGALRGTLARLEAMSIPTEGRLILVNIASRSLAAYEDGNPVIESRVVIGREGWRTPDLAVDVAYVRPNPTWTVPESIVRANGWRGRLVSDPAYFARNGFDVVVRGRAVDPRDVSAADAAKAVFVQRPARDNALGRLKIGLLGAGNIYLHDTNDKAAYDRQGVESHGCIRVEAIRDLAAWILGKDKAEVTKLIQDGDRANLRPEKPVKVVVGYFTAWPDGDGKVHYFRDIYGRDPRAPSCGRADADAVESPYGDQKGISDRPDGDEMPAVDMQGGDEWRAD